MYNEIWQYLEKYIPQETYELILSPIYELNNISFASICENNVVSKNENSPIENQINRGRVGSNKTINSCNYLIDKYSIRYVQSARSILKEYDKLKLKSSVLAIGGVDYNNTSSVDTENYENKILNKDINSELSESIKVLRKLSKAVDFEFLPNTEIEVDEIAEECREKSWKVKLLKSQYADESNLINTLSNNSFEILHFATHGFSFREDKSIDYQTIESYKDPLNRCGLIMAGGNKSWSSLADVISIKTTKENDGILTGNEVLNLPLLQTKLVVLSACETSIGKIEGMESSLSLNRMFLMSGVEYVISSLWPVPDLETMELMTLFYSDLTKTLSPIISFEKAQKEIRYKYPTEPEKWAGFVLVR